MDLEKYHLFCNLKEEINSSRKKQFQKAKKSAKNQIESHSFVRDDNGYHLDKSEEDFADGEDRHACQDAQDASHLRDQVQKLQVRHFIKWQKSH